MFCCFVRFVEGAFDVCSLALRQIAPSPENEALRFYARLTCRRQGAPLIPWVAHRIGGGPGVDLQDKPFSLPLTKGCSVPLQLAIDHICCSVLVHRFLDFEAPHTRCCRQLDPSKKEINKTLPLSSTHCRPNGSGPKLCTTRLAQKKIKSSPK